MKPPWNFYESIFAQSRRETQELMDQMFENDWSLMQKPNFKDEEEAAELKTTLKHYFWIIWEVFKYNAAYSTMPGT